MLYIFKLKDWRLAPKEKRKKQRIVYEAEDGTQLLGPMRSCIIGGTYAVKIGSQPAFGYCEIERFTDYYIPPPEPSVGSSAKVPPAAVGPSKKMGHEARPKASRLSEPKPGEKRRPSGND